MEETQPLLLVEGSKSDGSITINATHLSKLIASVENVPLSVVTVAGPPNTGKSLIFGYLIRYFIAVENDQLDWMDRDNPTKDLHELAWRLTKSSKHYGIWSFHRPFLANNHGVILLYAQTSWNADTTQNCSLLGLISCVSSTTIYNVSKNLDEECLNAIATSIKLAALGSLSNDANKNMKPASSPFQHACFVIRDWNFASRFAYGMRGGKEFVKFEKLKEKETHTTKLRENRCIINKFFSEIFGSLMPFPGLKFSAIAEHTYSINEMGKEFSEKLGELIESVINIDEIILKKDVFGNQVTGKTFEDIWTNFLEATKNIDVSTVNTKNVLRRFQINLETSISEKNAAVKAGMKTYLDTWKKHEKSGKLLNEKTMKDIQRKARANALKTLEKVICGKTEDNDSNSGSETSDGETEELQVTEELKDELQQKMVKQFHDIKLRQSQKQAEVTEQYKNDILEEYKESIQSSFPFGSKPPAGTKFNRKSKSLIESLCLDFEDKLETSGVKPQEKDLEDLEERLLKEEQALFSKLLSTEMENTFKQEDEASNWSNDSSDLSLSRNTSFHSLNRSVQESVGSTSSRQSEVSYDGEEFEPAHKSTPKRKSERQIREEKKREEAKLKDETKQLVDRLAKAFQTELNAHVADVSKDLSAIHKEISTKKVETFQNDVPYDKSRNEYKLYKDILIDEMNAILSSARLQRKQVIKKAEIEDENLVKTTLKDYEKSLENLIETNENISLETLVAENKSIEEREMNRLSTRLNNKSLVSDVENKMKNVFKKIKLNVKDEPENSIDSDLKEAKEAYTRRMRDLLNKSGNSDELLRNHETVVTELTSRLTNNSSKPSSNPTLLNEVRRTLNSAFDDMKEKINLKQENEKGSVKMATQEARAYFCEEMRKRFSAHRHFTQSEMAKFYRESSNETKRKFPKANSSELDLALQAAFKRFEDENAMNKNDEEPAIGIDLGTTYSCVSVYQRGKVVILPNQIGKQTTPSYVQFQENGQEIIGEPAKIRAYENPEGTIFDAKRILGRKFNDSVLQEDMKLWPFTVVDGGHGVPMIEVDGKRYNPEMISAKVLEQLRKDAEEFLKQKISKAVITVPAYFTDGQKQATIDAGKMAGLEVLSILTEPVAAAMAYKLQYSAEQTGGQSRHILVFDLGGGTFDVAVVKASEGKLDVITVDGDTHLGGEDFDKNLMNYCAEEFKKTHDIDLFEGKDSSVKKTRDEVRRRLKRIQAVCEMQKIALTTSRSVDITVDNIHSNKDLDVTITRSTFEKINESLFAKTVQVVENALKSAKLSKTQIDDIVLVGGSTRIPKVQQLLRDYFTGKELDKKINPDEAVAHGAGLMAAIKQGSVAKDSSIFTKVQEVTPMSIGVEIYGGAFSVIIPRNTKTPVMLQERYKTAHNNQTSVQITIYEGENKIAVDNTILGDFYLNGIPPKEAGVENIDVEMVINEQGILHVTAKCSSTGTKKGVTVTENKQRMGQATIQRYLADASA